MRQWMRERQQLLWIVGTVVFGTTILSLWLWLQPKSEKMTTPPLAVLSMKKSMKAHPRWKRFEKLSNDIEILEEKLKSLGALPEEVSKNGTDASNDRLGFSTGDQMLFRSEMELQMEIMSQAAQRWENDLRQEIASQMKIKEEQLQNEIKDAVDERQKLYREKMDNYKQEVDLEYSLKLTNIEFKSKVPGISAEEKMLLDNEASEIKRTVQILLQSKEAEYEKELKEFVDRRRAAAKKEMEDYFHQLQADARRRSELQKKRLQQELEAWQKQRVNGFRQSMEAKKRRYAVEINALQSLRAERDLLQIRMNTDIRRKTRELAEKEGFSAVVLDPLYGSTRNDITQGLINSYR